MNRAPIRILVTTLITGIICIIGIMLITSRLMTISDMHEKIMNEAVEDRECMAQISMYLDRHHALINCMMITEDEDAFDRYQAEEQEIEKIEKELLFRFHDRCISGEKAKLFHKIYSNYCSYLNNCSTLITFTDERDTQMVAYYNDNTLMTFINQIRENIGKMDAMIVDDISQDRARIDDCIRISRIMSYSCVAVVIVMLGICIFTCFRIAAGLDNVRQDLETELISKNQTLQEHNENLIRLQDGIIISIADIIEDRDTDTGEHVKRTSYYVELLARAAKKKGLYRHILTEEFIDLLIKAAPLHDIGKISVSDSILLKPGRLSSDEFEKMKLHAKDGGRIIRQVFGNIENEAYINMAADVALYHHEKWDGTGYNEGRKGEDIPLSARIMAIADVFDALVSKRCYKDAYDFDEAFEIIKASAGSHFDPLLTKVFLSLKPRIEEYLLNEEFEG